MKYRNYWKHLHCMLIICCAVLFTGIVCRAAEENPQFSLTEDEQAYVESAGEITVGQIRNRYPITNLDENTGTLSGINEDLLDKISEISGLKLVSEPIGLNEKPMAALKEKKFDLVMGVLQTDNFLKDQEIQLSDPFLESTLAVVMRRGESFESSKTYSIALKNSFQAIQEYIQQTYPQFEIHIYTTDEDALHALIHGDVDLMLQNVYVMSYLLQKPQYSDVQILPTTFLTEKNCIAARAETDPRLISIINKAVKAIPTEDRNEIILANTTAQPYHLTSADVLYKYRTQIILAAILILACITLLAVILMIRQKNLKIMQVKNAQLADAVAQAEKANSAKSQFLSQMSHEIRTPMNAIVGITTIAKQHENEPEKIDDYLGKIATSSRVLLNIINDVLDMSAIESNKLKIASAEFDIKQVLSSISTIYYTQCKNKGIHFTMATDLEDEMLVGDSLRVNQIMMNLVSNAYKFTEAGGEIKILAKEIARKDNKVFVRFTVSDTGCGMTKEMQERLFKPFEQESATTAQKHGGSGLGMSIAKNLVDMMQGAIHVESEKGKGTTFTVELPFETTGKINEEDKEQVKKLKALIIDDDESVREYTSIVLGRIGLKYDAAGSGLEALGMIKEALLSGHPYDVCFVDWKMPDMNGIQVTQKIRESMGDQPVIIIVSAYDLNEVEDEAKSAGADLFVAKPMFQSSVFNVLMSLSGGKLKKETAAFDDYDFAGHKVLLAEDNELNREIAVELLKMVNMETDCAENGQKAVDMFQSSAPGTYDVILMDVQMPVMDGYDATKVIRKLDHPQAKDIPIFAMTANAFTEDISAALAAGMNGHIAKPIDTEVLYQTLQKTIQKTIK